MFVDCCVLLVAPKSGKQLHTRRFKKLFLFSRATTHPHVIYLFVVACLLTVCVIGRGGVMLHQQVAKRCTSRWRKVAPAGGEKLRQQVANSCTNRWRNVALNRVCKCKSTLFLHGVWFVATAVCYVACVLFVVSGLLLHQRTTSCTHKVTRSTPCYLCILCCLLVDCICCTCTGRLQEVAPAGGEHLHQTVTCKR